MLLNALWNGACSPLTAPPDSQRILEQSFDFPVIFLQRSDIRCSHVSVYGDDLMLGTSLTLGDVLQHELGLVVPYGTPVVVLGRNIHRGIEQGMEVLAEILHLRAQHSSESQPLSLTAWAFLSLSMSWGWAADDYSFLRSRDAVLSRVLSYPAGRAEMSLVSYLAQAEPGSSLPRADESLSSRLACCSTTAEWFEAVQKAFAEACLAQSLARN